MTSSQTPPAPVVSPAEKPDVERWECPREDCEWVYFVADKKGENYSDARLAYEEHCTVEHSQGE